MKKTKIQKVDRISELPEPILHHILSFLNFREVARTCLLSKKWERVWLSYPVVEIYNSPFISCFHYKKKVFRRRRLKLLDAIEKGLRNRHHHCKDLVRMEKFIIVMELLEDREFSPFVDRCVSYAIGCNVKKLRLDFGLDDNDDEDEGDREKRWYNLPPMVLCAKSLEVLKLGRCKFSYKKPLVYGGEASSCFKSHPISCWQHCIEEAKLEIRNSDRIDIKGCSLKGVEFLEKIDGLCTPQKYDEVGLI